MLRKCWLACWSVANVYLSVCLSLLYSWQFNSDLHQTLPAGSQGSRKEMINFWKRGSKFSQDIGQSSLFYDNFRFNCGIEFKRFQLNPFPSPHFPYVFLPTSLPFCTQSYLPYPSRCCALLLFPQFTISSLFSTPPPTLPLTSILLFTPSPTGLSVLDLWSISCLSLCQTITFEVFDLESLFLVSGYIFLTQSFSSFLKVIGSRSRSR